VFLCLVVAGTLADTTERVSLEGYAILPSATASSGSDGEGGGGDDDGDQGGDEGGGDQNGDEEGGGEGTDGSADLQPDSDTGETGTTDEETETAEETEPEPTPPLLGGARTAFKPLGEEADPIPPPPPKCPDGTIPRPFVGCQKASPTPTPTPSPTPIDINVLFCQQFPDSPGCEGTSPGPTGPPAPLQTRPSGFLGDAVCNVDPTYPGCEPTTLGGPFPTVPEGTRLDPYAECIFNPNLLQCERDGPADPNLPPLTPPDAITCNLDKNYPGCAGADILKFNQQSIACESAPNRNLDLYFCKNPVVQSATTTPTTQQKTVPALPDGTCPPGSFVGGGTGGKTGVGTVTCIAENPTTTPPTTTPTTTPSPSPNPSPSPTPSPTPTTITNINNNQVTVQNGRFAVQDTAGAVTATPDCPPESATIVLGPSPMQSGGARILAALDPCVLTDGGVVLNIPDEQGIQVVAANIQGGQTTQSVIVPMQRIAPITQGQTLYTVDLSGQITGQDPATGAQATLNGNINALFLRNAGGQNVEFSADNTAALNAILRR
jgi:hypothetical protein